MRTLTLLRHAKAVSDDVATCDFDRALTDDGRDAAVAMGRWLRDDGRRFDHVAASPAKRVAQTIDAVTRGYGELPAAEGRRALYLAPLATLLDAIRGFPDDATDVLIVGHNPGLGDLAVALSASGDAALRGIVATGFPTATVAVIATDRDWPDLADHGGRLVSFVRPTDLDRALGSAVA